MIPKSVRYTYYLSIGWALAASISIVDGAEIPTLGDLGAEILKATVPTTAYRVAVVQTTDAIPTTSALGKTRIRAAQAEPAVRSLNRSVYTLHFVPQKGFRTELAPSPKVAGPSAAEAVTPAQARLAINIPNFLKKIDTWPTTSVAKVVLDGKACYKVSASTLDAASLFWVEAETHCILKVIADIRGQRYAESVFSYRRSGENGWLLSGVETTYPMDSSRVLLEYGNYDFSAER